MIHHLFEHSWFKEANASSESLQVPNDAWSIWWSRDSHLVIPLDFNVIDSGSVLFKRSFHSLCLSSNFPDSNLSFHTSRDNSGAVTGGSKSSYPMVVGIIDSVEEFSRLGKESSDLSIIPTWDNTLSIVNKVNAESFKPWDFNSEQLLPSLSIPNSDVVEWASSEEIRVKVRECDVINSFIMASVS